MTRPLAIPALVRASRVALALAWLAVGGQARADAPPVLLMTQGVFGRGLVVPVGGPAEEAVALVEAHEWEAAAEAWHGVAQRSEGADARLWEIACWLRAERFDRAHGAVLETIARTEPGPNVVLAAALVLTETGAARDAARLLTDYPVSDVDLVGAHVLRMRALTMLGRRRAAARVRARAEFAGQTDPWFWLEVGMEAAYHGDPEADRLFERATRVDGADAFHTLVLSRHLAATGRPEEAVQQALKGMARFPDDVGLPRFLADLCTERGPRAALAGALVGWPDHPSGHAVLGLAYIAQEEMRPDAVHHLQLALSLGELDPVLYLELTQLLALAGDEGAALSTAREGAANFPDDVALHEEHLRLAHRAGTSADVLVAFESGTESGRDDPRFLVAFASFLLDPGGDVSPDADRARQLAEQAVGLLEKPDAVTLDTLARACWATGERLRAVELLVRAVALDPSDQSRKSLLDSWRAGAVR